MSNSTMMEYISQQYPVVYKSSEPGIGGQKVVCTPEVSLYQYNGVDGLGRLEEKAHADLLPTRLDGGSGESATGSTSSTSGFQCGFCGKTFQQKNTFQNHLRSHREGEDPYQCDICGKTFAVPARLTRHYRTHTGEKPFCCDFCNKSFSVKENLSVHRRIHTKERPYKCEVCERAFEHSGKLHRHMRIHTGERPHRCQICQKTFIQSGQLVIHMRTHTGEKPYVCKVCNKGFTCSKQLKVHTRTHTGEKPYTCDICGKSFGYNHVLKLHQVAHYGEKVYKCTICNGTFTSKKSLEAHIKTHSEGTVPTDSTSPAAIEPSLPSPSLSQAPQNSDKENRDSSDSEISSQSSLHGESPKTPPSPPPPVSYGDSSSFKQTSSSMSRGAGGVAAPTNPTVMSPGHRERDGNFNISKGNNISKNVPTTHPSSLPYPMLPPGVQVHQNPQSRTTFLYVTSKLPVPPNGTGTVNPIRADSPPPPITPRHLSQITPTKQHISLSSLSSSNSFKAFGGLLSNGSVAAAGIGSGGKLAEGIVQREKQFFASANIRDKKVLPFLEQFGYGLPKDGPPPPPSICRNERKQQQQQQQQMATAPLGRYSRSSPPCSLELSPSGRDSSPERMDYNNAAGVYTHGGVLALALTRGSKAAMQSPHFNSFRQQNSSPRSEESSEGLDFSSQRSLSPRNCFASHPSPISRSSNSSTPGLTDELDEGHRSAGEELNNNDVNMCSGSKRRGSGGGGSGPRKRSSLILEKYAQENPADPTPQQQHGDTADSILSQRLRLSSVIQYAEKCS